MAPSGDAGHEVGLVAHDLADHEDGADHAPLLEIVEEFIGDSRESQFGRLVGAVVFEVEGEDDAHVVGLRHNERKTPSARSRWKTQLSATDDITIIAMSIGTR